MEINPYKSPVFGPHEEFVPPRGTGVLAALAEGLRLYLRNWRLIGVVMLMVHIPLALWSSYAEYFIYGPDDIWGASILQVVQELFFWIIATAAIQHIVSLAARQQRPTLWSAFHCALSLWPRMWLIAFLWRILIVLAFFVFIIPGIFFAVVFSLVDVVAVAENRSAVGSLSRSRELARGHFWFLFGVIFLAYFLYAMFSFLVISPAIILDEVHWLLNAALLVIVSLALPYPQTCLFAAYQQLVDE